MIGRIKSLLFKNQTAAQTVAKNTFWLFAGEIIGRVFRVGIVIYAARIIGAAGYGAFSYAMATAGLVTILSDVGISSVLTRESVKFPELRRQYFSTALAIKGVLISINIFLVIYILPQVTTVPAAKTLFPFVAFILAFDTLRDFGSGLLRALQRMELEALTKILTNIAIAGVSFLFIIHSATTISLANGYAVGTGIGFAITLIMLWPYFAGLFTHFDRTLVKKIIVSAWPIGLLGLLGAITLNTDMIMLGWLRTPAELGYYAAAQKPIQFLYIIPGLLASAVFPLFTKLVHENPSRLKSVLERSAAISLLIAMPIVLGGLILSTEIITLLFGTGYAAAIISFQLLLITLLINAPGMILNNVILAHDKQLYFLRFFAAGAISNIIFNVLLIPPYGIAGAAIATILAQIVSNAFIWTAVRKLSPFSITPYLRKLTIASLIMAASTYGMRVIGLNFFVNLGASALIYFAVLTIMQEPLLREGRAILRRPQG